MAALKPCPLCGHPVEASWDGCLEIAGHCWQTLSVRCTNPERYGCYVNLSIEVDGDHAGLAGAANEVAARAWNAFATRVERRRGSKPPHA